MRKKASKYRATLLSKENSFNGIHTWFKDVRITSIRRISPIRNAKSLHVRWMRLAALCLDRKNIFPFFSFVFLGFMIFWYDFFSGWFVITLHLPY